LLVGIFTLDDTYEFQGKILGHNPQLSQETKRLSKKKLFTSEWIFVSIAVILPLPITYNRWLYNWPKAPNTQFHQNSENCERV